jgi:hypothetical protein
MSRLTGSQLSSAINRLAGRQLSTPDTLSITFGIVGSIVAVTGLVIAYATWHIAVRSQRNAGQFALASEAYRTAKHDYSRDAPGERRRHRDAPCDAEGQRSGVSGVRVLVGEEVFREAGRKTGKTIDSFLEFVTVISSAAPSNDAIRGYQPPATRVVTGSTCHPHNRTATHHRTVNSPSISIKTTSPKTMASYAESEIRLAEAVAYRLGHPDRWLENQFNVNLQPRLISHFFLIV